MGEGPSAEAFAGLPRVWRPRASPTGDAVAFFWNPGERYELFVYDIDADERWPVTDGHLHRSPNAPPVWAPSGDALYFQTGKHGYALGSIHRVTLDGAVERVATPGGGWGMLWGVDPTGSWLLCSLADDDERVRLYRYEVKSDDRILLSDEDAEVPSRGARIAPDGSRLCYPDSATGEPGHTEAYVVDASGSNRRRLSISGTDSVRTQTWHPGEDIVLLYDEENDRTGEFDLTTHDIRWCGPGTPVSYLNPTTILTRGARLYDRETGDASELDIGGVGDNLIADGIRLGSDRIVFARDSERRPSELYSCDWRTGEEIRLVAAEFGPLDPDGFVTAEDVTYESVDGRTVEGLLYRPEHADETDPVPVVVEAHGFPAEASRRFEPEIQFFAARGYAVLEPNYRGAARREEGFAASIAGDWGGAEQDDIVAAASWLADRDWAASDRIALYGHSFGGFTVYTQLVRYPEAWTVGIASGGITDLHLLDAAKGGNDLLREQMGHPREDAGLWRDRSPITHVENVERPLLILHGTADPTAPVSQARAFSGALQAVKGWTDGEEFEYREVESGEHGNLDHETNARRWKRMVDFLERRL